MPVVGEPSFEIRGVVAHAECRLELFVGRHDGGQPAGRAAPVGGIPALDAVLDTGATASAISERRALELGLQVVDVGQVSTASSDGEVLSRPIVLALVSMISAGGSRRTTLHRLTVMPMLDDVLLGMDFLLGGILTIDRRDPDRGTWSLRYVGAAGPQT